MKVNNKKTITFIVPTEDGEAYELSFDKSKAKKIVATKPMVEILSQNSIAIAKDKSYDLIMLDL